MDTFSFSPDNTMGVVMESADSGRPSQLGAIFSQQESTPFQLMPQPEGSSMHGSNAFKMSESQSSHIEKDATAPEELRHTAQSSSSDHCSGTVDSKESVRTSSILAGGESFSEVLLPAPQPLSLRMLQCQELSSKGSATRIDGGICSGPLVYDGGADSPLLSNGLAIVRGGNIDMKGDLQRLLVGRYKLEPIEKLIRYQCKPILDSSHHQLFFVATVVISRPDRPKLSVLGQSKPQKKAAEQSAALNALRNLRQEQDEEKRAAEQSVVVRAIEVSNQDEKLVQKSKLPKSLFLERQLSDSLRCGVASRAGEGSKEVAGGVLGSLDSQGEGTPRTKQLSLPAEQVKCPYHHSGDGNCEEAEGMSCTVSAAQFIPSHSSPTVAGGLVGSSHSAPIVTGGLVGSSHPAPIVAGGLVGSSHSSPIVGGGLVESSHSSPTVAGRLVGSSHSSPTVAGGLMGFVASQGQDGLSEGSITKVGGGTANISVLELSADSPSLSDNSADSLSLSVIGAGSHSVSGGGAGRTSISVGIDVLGDSNGDMKGDLQRVLVRLHKLEPVEKLIRYEMKGTFDDLTHQPFFIATVVISRPGRPELEFIGEKKRQKKAAEQSAALYALRTLQQEQEEESVEKLVQKSNLAIASSLDRQPTNSLRLGSTSSTSDVGVSGSCGLQGEGSSPTGQFIIPAERLKSPYHHSGDGGRKEPGGMSATLPAAAMASDLSDEVVTVGGPGSLSVSDGPCAEGSGSGGSKGELQRLLLGRYSHSFIHDLVDYQTKAAAEGDSPLLGFRSTLVITCPGSHKLVFMGVCKPQKKAAEQSAALYALKALRREQQEEEEEEERVVQAQKSCNGMRLCEVRNDCNDCGPSERAEKRGRSNVAKDGVGSGEAVGGVGIGFVRTDFCDGELRSDAGDEGLRGNAGGDGDQRSDAFDEGLRSDAGDIGKDVAGRGKACNNSEKSISYDSVTVISGGNGNDMCDGKNASDIKFDRSTMGDRNESNRDDLCPGGTSVLLKNDCGGSAAFIIADCGSEQRDCEEKFPVSACASLYQHIVDPAAAFPAYLSIQPSHHIEPPGFAADISDGISIASCSTVSSITTSPSIRGMESGNEEDHKGALQTFVDRLFSGLANMQQQQRVKYQTVESQRGFRSTVTVLLPNGGRVSTAGDDAANKKAAEKSAAKKALSSLHSGVAEVSPRDTGCPNGLTVEGSAGYFDDDESRLGVNYKSPTIDLSRVSQTFPAHGTEALSPTDIAVTPPTSSTSTASGDVTCARAGHLLGSTVYFFLCLKSETEIIFGLKPEQADVFLALKTVIKRRADILCSQCAQERNSAEAKIGICFQNGPNNCPLIQFGREKVRLFGSNGAKWSFYEKLPVSRMIERRTMANFFGGQPSEVTTAAVERAANGLDARLVFPNARDAAALAAGWKELLHENCRKTPQQYQRSAFQQALSDNLLVCIPTGFGKTFIAALVMVQMKVLNPMRQVVMIVDRIPLVYQQQGAIQQDTNLSICALCSQSNTRYCIERLRDGHFDGLVVTAGTLSHCLEEKSLFLTEFSLMVFDECHHAVGDHVYSKLLEKVKSLSIHERPRLLGLTASPTSATTVERASANLDQILAVLSGSKLFFPSVPKPPNGIEWRRVQLKDSQVQCSERLAAELIPLVHSLQMILSEAPEALSIQQCADMNRWAAFTHLATTVRNDSHKDEHITMAKTALRLIDDLQLNYHLGSCFVEGSEDDPVAVVAIATGDGLGTLTQMPPSSTDETADGIPDTRSLFSAQLQELVTILRSVENSSTHALVFVETRNMAKILNKILRVAVPDFKSDIVVGQAGLDGMNWKGDTGQGAVLQKFRDDTGKRLLVCTSVLEEGLDVQKCDLVIRFGGRPSLIQLIQSRGRARAEEGKLIVIHTDEESEHYESIRHQEKIMNAVLKLRDSLGQGQNDDMPLHDSDRPAIEPGSSLLEFDPTTVLGSIRDDDSVESGTMTIQTDPRPKSYALQLYTKGASSRSAADMQQDILHEFENSGLVTEVLRVEVLAGSAASHAASPNIFLHGDMAVLVNVTSAFSDFAKRLAFQFSFRLRCIVLWMSPIVQRGSTRSDDIARSQSQMPWSRDVADEPSSTESSASIKLAMLASSGTTKKTSTPEPMPSDEAVVVSLDGILTIECGHFDGPQTFVVEKPLGESEVCGYTQAQIVAGKSLQLLASQLPSLSTSASTNRSKDCSGAGADVGDAACTVGTIVDIPVGILGPCIYISGDRHKKVFTVYVLLASTPRVYLSSASGRKSRVYVPPHFHTELCANTISSSGERKGEKGEENDDDNDDDDDEEEEAGKPGGLEGRRGGYKSGSESGSSGGSGNENFTKSIDFDTVVPIIANSSSDAACVDRSLSHEDDIKQQLALTADVDDPSAAAVTAVTLAAAVTSVTLAADIGTVPLTDVTPLDATILRPKSRSRSKSKPKALPSQALVSSAHSDLFALAACPVVAITFHWKQWDHVVSSLSNAQLLGVPAFITHVSMTMTEVSADFSRDLSWRVEFPSGENDESDKNDDIDGHDSGSCVCHDYIDEDIVDSEIVPSSSSTRSSSQLESSAENDRRKHAIDPTHRDPSSCPPERHILLGCYWELAALAKDTYCVGINEPLIQEVAGTIEAAIGNKDIDELQAIRFALPQLHQILTHSNLWENAHDLFSATVSTCRERVRSANFDVVDKADAFLDHFLIGRVVLTPSRVVPHPSVPVQSNRLLRQFAEKYQFIYVMFRDEQGQRLYSEDIFRNRYKVILEDGMNICGQHFQFVFSSASQLREQTGVFVAGDKSDVANIRQALIPDITSCGSGHAKRLSRLGLFCTSDKVISYLQPGDYQDDWDDIETTGEKLENLTDGSGFIDESFLRSLNVEECLIQIRSMGCKGTLLSIPQGMAIAQEPGGLQVKVAFRKSEKKCISTHNALCLVKAASYNRLRFNREIINLLCAFQAEGRRGGDWSCAGSMHELLSEALSEVVMIFNNVNVALKRLETYFNANLLKKVISSGVNILTDPLWLSFLKLIYDTETKALRRKTHIPIKKGCLLMGAPDPLGILSDGEIFLRIHDFEGDSGSGSVSVETRGEGVVEEGEQEEGEAIAAPAAASMRVITGPVIIYRNPCLDPGDVRIVTAVDKPELHRWTNIVLLPASSSCTRSLAAECSGGDLDGDCFGIIWDQRFVPPFE